MTRAKVTEMAIKLGYCTRGRGTDGGNAEVQRHRIAVVPQSREFRNSVNTIRLLEGITLGADAGNLSLTLGMGLDPNHPGKQLVPNCIIDSPCDLALLLGRHHPSVVRAIRERCPVVSIEWSYASVSLDQACTDDTSGIMRLTERVFDMGHRHIAWVGEAYAASFHDRRLSGLIQACCKRGVDIASITRLGIDAFDAGGHLIPQRIRELIDAGTTCIMCVTDRVAFEVCGLLSDWNISIPQQISVTGFDAMQSAGSLRGWSQLTSVDPCFVEIGRAAVELAQRRLDNPAAHPICISPEPKLVDGDTLGPIGN